MKINIMKLHIAIYKKKIIIIYRERMGYLKKRAARSYLQKLRAATGDGKTCLYYRRGVMRVNGFCRHFT